MSSLPYLKLFTRLGFEGSLVVQSCFPGRDAFFATSKLQLRELHDAPRDAWKPVYSPELTDESVMLRSRIRHVWSNIRVTPTTTGQIYTTTAPSVVMDSCDGQLRCSRSWRWHFSGESFPCFRTSQDCYGIKVLKRDNTHTGVKLSDSTASSWTQRLYAVSGIKGSKVTQLPRSSGARIAEANNVQKHR